MNAQRAAVSTGPSGVSRRAAGVGWSFLPLRRTGRARRRRRGLLLRAGRQRSGDKMADASRAERRVSIATQLLFHHDPRIGYSGAEHLVQHHVGLLHGRERPDDHAIRLGARPSTRADDARRRGRQLARAGCRRTGNSGSVPSRTIQTARVRRRLGHRLRQPRDGVTAAPAARRRLRRRGGRTGCAGAALPGGGRSLCCTSPTRRRGEIAASARPAQLRPLRGSPPATPRSRTRATPSAGKPSSVAVRRVTSISRCGVAGPRSLIRTTTCRPFSRLVSRAIAGSCRVWCAAASAVWSNTSPSAVRSAMAGRVDRREAGLARRRSFRADSTRRRPPDTAHPARNADWPAAAAGRTPASTPPADSGPKRQRLTRRPSRPAGRPRARRSPTGCSGGSR